MEHKPGEPLCDSCTHGHNKEDKDKLLFPEDWKKAWPCTICDIETCYYEPK